MADSALYTAALAVYDFENNANDTKGAKNLTANGTWTYSTTGEAQGTYWAQSDATGDNFTRTDSDFQFAGDYSLSAYVNFTYAEQGYYTKIASCYSGGDGDGWIIDLSTRDLRVRHITAWSTTTATWDTNLSNNVRYHIALAYDDSENTITAWVSTTSFGNVINGSAQAMAANPGVGGTPPLNLGGDPDYFVGYLDEVVFWSGYVLSASDAGAIFGARDGGTSWREASGASSTPIFRRRLNILLRLCFSSISTLFGRLVK